MLPWIGSVSGHSATKLSVDSNPLEGADSVAVCLGSWEAEIEEWHTQEQNLQAASCLHELLWVLLFLSMGTRTNVSLSPFQLSFPAGS